MLLLLRSAVYFTSSYGIVYLPCSSLPKRGRGRLVVVLLEQLLAELDVLVLGILLAQASVDLLLPLVVLGLALRCVSFRPKKMQHDFQEGLGRIECLLEFVIFVQKRRARTARLNMPGFSALLKSLPSATLA